jgi:hypothetical protein
VPLSAPHQPCDNLNPGGAPPQKKSATGRASQRATSATSPPPTATARRTVHTPPSRHQPDPHQPRRDDARSSDSVRFTALAAVFPCALRQVSTNDCRHAAASCHPQHSMYLPGFPVAFAEYHTVHNQPSHFQPSTRHAESSKQNQVFPPFQPFSQPFTHQTLFAAPAECFSISSRRVATSERVCLSRPDLTGR